jgi:hypothetical protein
MKEGKMKKGGINRTYQIAERPPDPPPMRPATWVCGMCGRVNPADGVSFCPCRPGCPKCGAGICEHVRDAVAGLVLDVKRLEVDPDRREIEALRKEARETREGIERIATRARAESIDALGPEARALLAEIARELDALAGGP